MNENWNTTMGEALRLTRAGQLAEATSLLQNGLAGKAGSAPSTSLVPRLTGSLRCAVARSR